ncbi:MAG TPA: hypothetical protein VMW56_05965 [Candidatus Margulisiibacteriota bacterium]|nr:hypothetical protein [Candidatus Margulisiibacteriota bacterium]
MRRASIAVLLCTLSSFVAILPAQATFHIMVIEQVFTGFQQAPHAQYVMLRMQAVLQTAVFGQPFPVFDAAGNPVGTFAAFCANPSACSLPAVSPACAAKDCPNPIDANNRNVLAATPWAQELFCVTADVLATGVLPYPDGRACFGDCDLRPDCGSGPVDCVAYGNFTGDNAPFGSPAMSPMLGEALVADPLRQNQFLKPNDPLLDNSAGFSVGAPAPVNFHGDVGAIDGVAGNPEGSGVVDARDVDAEVAVLFETDRRCSLPPAQRGADANFDTRVNAADVVATIRILGSPPSAELPKA